MGTGLAAALTPAGLLGQLPFVLLIAAILSTRADRVRLLTALAGLIGLAHAFLIQGSVVLASWWALLLIATLLVIGRRVAEDGRVRFSEDEEAMLRGVFSALPRGRARHLLDQGFWLTGSDGDVLTREGEAVTHLYYLSAGEARVVSHGRQVGACRSGDLIGEATIMSGDQASATVILSGPARFWCAPANVLRPYLQTHEEVRRALERGFANALKAKLRQSNERIAESGGVTA
jgi:hypothetical protein